MPSHLINLTLVQRDEFVMFYFFAPKWGSEKGRSTLMVLFSLNRFPRAISFQTPSAPQF